MEENKELMKNIKDNVDSQYGPEFMKKNSIISKDEPFPEGYNRNSFSDTTCLTTQTCDLPKWEDIIATVEHKGQLVYEDHFILAFTSQSRLYSVRRKNPGPFIGRVKLYSRVEHTFGKIKKNTLFLILDTLYVDLS